MDAHASETLPADPGFPADAGLPADDDLGERVTRSVARIYRRFRAERTNGELGDAAMNVLGHLHRYGPATLTALSDHERVTAASMSQTVNRLVSLGYAIRAADPTDGRRVLFSPTAEGHRVAGEARARRHAWLDAQLATRTPEERVALAEAARVLWEMAEG
ncbi:MarR family winged helix-turn-helix transcriptional regulator [Leifsonia sp. NPDC102414]|uniref:MarR family winged helix-turn-helix transcriptional regulator n=1 Tax=Leifsonia sp. NPDC102414 TaxID=3364124 RepID=UPI00380EB74D